MKENMTAKQKFLLQKKTCHTSQCYYEIAFLQFLFVFPLILLHAQTVCYGKAPE